MSNEDSVDCNKLGAFTSKDDLIDGDDIFNELENEDVPSHIREARLNELVLKAMEKKFIEKNKYSIYGEISEDEFLKVTTSTKKCIIHFYHADFRRCDIINSHLQKIAPKYEDIRFAKINVEKAKFFVDKLKVQVLPAILCFVDGVLKDKVIGFDELGSNDNFPTEVLEKRLKRKGILKRDDDDENDESEDEKKRSIFRKGNRNDDDSDDSD